MTNKIVAIQGNHPSKLNPKTDTSVFLANEIQKKKYRIFYYDPKDLSIVDSKVIAKGFFIKFNYNDKKFYKILKKQKKNRIHSRKFSKSFRKSPFTHTFAYNQLTQCLLLLNKSRPSPASRPPRFK